jgi:hypothetical protein
MAETRKGDDGRGDKEMEETESEWRRTNGKEIE